MQLNEVGFPVISDDLYAKVFGEVPRAKPTERQVSKARKAMDRFGIPNPVDYPDNLYTGEIPVPKLKADNIIDHFEVIADEQIGSYEEYAEEFSKAPLPEFPPTEVIKDNMNPGWTRFELVGGEWVITAEGPKEKAFTFDTETFVTGGSYPIIGTALSAKAYYLWIAKELVNPELPREEWEQFGLVPLAKDCFVAGHNISYDRVRVQEAYSLDSLRPENFYFDTLSAHVATAGLASGQRWLYTLVNKDPELLTEEERRRLRYRPRWVDEGSTNSLVATYNFHVYEPRRFFDEDVQPLDEGDKAVRKIFVDAQNLYQINAMLEDCVVYALKDAFYTAELFQAIWPKYRECSPSKVHLAGHYYLNGSRVPVVDNWYEWIKQVDDEFNERMAEVQTISEELVKEVYEEWRTLFDKDPEEAAKWVKADPWYSQMSWDIKTVKGKYAYCPEWYRPFKKDPNSRITTKSKLLHLLLRLKWEGVPIEWVEGMGWCYEDTSGSVIRVPHPKGNNDNVGGLLTKEFVKDAEVGRLSSDNPKAQRVLEVANMTSYWVGVRNRVVDRIVAKVENPHGEPALITCPNILVHGTVTRRTVENLLVVMCSTKSWRIGTELKSRFAAPDGWKIVMADFDAQEMSIASIYADRWEGNFVGASPMSYTVLSGAKENGSDSHTALARAIFKDEYKGVTWEGGKILHEGSALDPDKKMLLGSCRDVAKIVNFSVLYGAGVRTTANSIKRSFPDKSPGELNKFARQALAAKKGIKNEEGYFEGGSDSGAFNTMVKLGLKSKVPTLPALGTRISNALRPAVVGEDFATGRMNFTIQSAGAEMLGIILTATHWLMDEFKVQGQFAVSIHDELSWMVPEKSAKLFAGLFQIAHVISWARFHAGCGVNDLPLSRAFFSAVSIDNRIRKSPFEKTVTPSNPQGKT
ncbi:MAG: DNA polymerase, partial [Burkholderiaceae bacterium]